MKRVPGCRIARMLRAQKRRHLSFHTPGHKRAGADITELSYSDALYAPCGVLAETERDIARILGADAAFLLTDGSTCGIYAVIFALRKGGVRRLAVPAHAHCSVFHACEALGVRPVCMRGERAAGIPLQPSEAEIARALSGADALLLTSPDYYGYFAPLAFARELCAAAGKPLAVDGAHGAHLHGTPQYAGNYAQLWVDGVHKSLPALTQGAVVSARGAWVERLREGVRYFRTTSPSYPILASVEYAVRYPRNEALERAAQSAKRALGALDNPDWSKLVVPFGAYADEAQRFLEAHGIYPEFNDGNYIMFYLSPAVRRRQLARLVRLAAKLPRAAVTGEDGASDGASDAGRVETVPLALAEGRVCARACGIFPPCVPVVLAGERVSAPQVRRLQRAAHTYGLCDGEMYVYAEDE